MFQDAFPSSLMELVEHQRGVEESTRMLERVVVPLRQVMAGPLFSRVGAMSRGAGEGHADISVEEGVGTVPNRWRVEVGRRQG